MKGFLTLFIFILLTLPVFAAGGDSDYEPTPEATHIPAMIMVEDEDVDETIADLTVQGVTVLYHRENLLLTFIPVDVISTLRRAKGVKGIEYSKPRYNSPTMNIARGFNDAGLIGEGFNLPQAFTGKGVVVGMCDIGFDTRHVNFLSSDGTECRIRRVVHYREQQGLRDVYSTPQEIYDWHFDTDDDWHGTHTAGIAAGGYLEAGYYSLAPDADIVFTASQLSDVGLLAGVEDIIAYAKAEGKPAVINLSMGNNVGPHDGSSLFTRYLDLCADDAIICISAGNDGAGGEPRSMTFEFTEAKPTLQFKTANWDGFNNTGYYEIWSRDERPFTYTFFWSNSNTNKSLYPYEGILFAEDTPAQWRISTIPGDPDYDETMALHYSEGGYVTATGGVSPLNGHYGVTVEFSINSNENYGNNPWSQWWAGVKVDAEPGVVVDAFCAGGSFLRGYQGNPEPDNTMCISDLATGHRTISVGMTNNTDISEGQAPGGGYNQGEVCIHSSYGTTPDGRVMPLTCAPGAFITSSISSAYLAKYPDEMQYVDDSTTIGTDTYYWIGTLGTSMSTPFVAGCIATWLQAYPGLTSEQAQEIVLATNQTSGYPYPENPRHGRGWFDGYAGINRVLDFTETKAPSIEADNLALHVVGSELLIGNPDGMQLTVEFFTPSGMAARRENVVSTSASVSLTSLPSGLYLVRVSTPSGLSRTLKIMHNS